MPPQSSRQYIILPREGFLAFGGQALSMLESMPRVASNQPKMAYTLGIAGGLALDVLDTTRENGPKLVEMEYEVAEAVNASDSPVRAIPVVYYDRPDPRISVLVAGVPPPPAPPSTVNSFDVVCTDASTGGPVGGAIVMAFSDFANRYGDQGATDSAGRVSLSIYSSTIERLYVYAPAAYWGAFRENLPVTSTIRIDCDQVDLTYNDIVRHFYGSSNFNLSAGVKVGVIDSGVGPHNQLNLVNGINTVTGEPAHDYQDGGTHGTHVAGLIGSTGGPGGLRGVAPGVALHAYRVFGLGAKGASNYAILKAMIMAAADSCDIINLSLGGGPHDDIVKESIQDARNQGMLVVIAAGNDGRQRVRYPAAYPGALAVSAMGREGNFPPGSLDESDVVRPPSASTDPKEFVAGFSNVGPEISILGPGVGTLSTLPNNNFGPMSGTSMAAPVVAGAAACLLSNNPTILGMARSRARADAIEKLLLSNCVKRGFGLNYEGYGLPDPQKV